MDFSSETERTRIIWPIVVVCAFLALFWGLEVIDWLTGDFLYMDGWGIRPRRLSTLHTIFIAPFLHLGFGHVASNSFLFALLGVLIMWRDEAEFWVVSFITMVVSGLGVWFFANPNSVTIGASGIVFGYLGFLLLLGYFERSFVSITRAIILLILYGGVLWGVLPLESGVSWQGHLFGFIGGILAAYILARRNPEAFAPKPIEEIESEIKIL